ncbi:MAG: DUF1080 domain-containing protein [Bryobacteraceae bacterium]
MKTAFVSAIVLTLAACSGVENKTATPSADNTLTEQEKEAGWKLLFDGSTLEAWDDPGQRTPPADSWTIADGSIQSRAHPKIREDLMTKEAFGDFEMVFDWKISPGGNSGVKYQIQDRILLDRGKLNKKLKTFEEQLGYEIDHPVADRANLIGQGEEYVVAFEYQVIDDTGHADARRGAKYQAGALYSMVPAAKPMAKPVGEFNHSRIVKRGAQVEHWLNGEKVVDSSLDAPEIKEGADKRWKGVPRVHDGLTKRPKAETPVGLQNHGDEAWFRNIKIRRL